MRNKNVEKASENINSNCFPFSAFTVFHTQIFFAICPIPVTEKVLGKIIQALKKDAFEMSVLTLQI